MSLALVLSVGLDSSLLGTRNLLLQSAGYIVVSAFSLKEAVDRFLTGDFDLVLLDNSLPSKDRDRLTCLIRASGSRIPVASIAPECGHDESFADAKLESDSNKLLIGMRGLLIKAVKLPAARKATLRDQQHVTAAPGEEPPISSGSREHQQQETKPTRESFAHLAHAGERGFGSLRYRWFSR